MEDSDAWNPKRSCLRLQRSRPLCPTEKMPLRDLKPAQRGKHPVVPYRAHHRSSASTAIRSNYSGVAVINLHPKAGLTEFLNRPARPFSGASSFVKASRVALCPQKVWERVAAPSGAFNLHRHGVYEEGRPSQLFPEIISPLATSHQDSTRAHSV